MFNPMRVFAEPEHAVMSLEVQAAIAPAPPKKRSQFELLVRHFVDALLNNEMVSSDGEARSYLLQIAYAIALPCVVVALYLFVPYHAPGGRPYWSQAGDRYFYVVYSMVAIGAVTVFEWDLFFPGLVDIFVLSSLPVSRLKLFQARIASVGIFLGAAVVGLNLLGTIFFPASADMPSLARHLLAHFLAITAGGLFVAAFVLGSQAILLAMLGQLLFQKISPILQGLYITVLLTVLFLFPVISHYLSSLMTAHSGAVMHFPPFWFLGIYERVLLGSAALPIYSALAVRGVLAVLLAVGVAVLFYPLAYWRRTQHLLEGRPQRDSERSWDKPVNWLVHATVLRVPVGRAIYHFIGQTLLRTHRHRVYLAMYGGVGLALMVACGVMLQIEPERIRLVTSAEGLQAAVPIAAFWAVAGLRNAFASRVDQQGRWVFHVIRGRPGLKELVPGKRWAFFWALVLTLTTVLIGRLIGPREMQDWRETGIQVFAAASLCLLLGDLFFLKDTMIPFSGVRPASKASLAVVLIEYVALFPPLVLVAVSVEAWMGLSLAHLIETVVAVIVLHLALRSSYQKNVLRSANLMDVDDEEEEFPQRLGLRY
jgi:hypothetical protein